MMARDKIRGGIGFVIPYFIGIITCISYFLPASAQSVTFEKTYDYGLAEAATCIEQTDDGGYILAGRQGVSIGTRRLLVVKVDSLGKVQWEKFYGSPGIEIEASSVEITTDSGYVICGYKTVFGNGADVVIMKLDESGDSLWVKSYGTTHYENGWDIKETYDEGFIIATTWAGDSASLIRTDDKGAMLWRQAYLPPSHLGSAAFSVVQTPDSGFCFAGLTVPDSQPGDVWVVRTDKNGAALWNTMVGGPENERGQDIVICKDGGFIVTGYTWSYGMGDYDVYLIKLNESGDTLWTKTYGSERENTGRSIMPAKDGGYIIGGTTSSWTDGSYNYNMQLIYVDSTGIPIWTKEFGSQGSDIGYEAIQASDGGYIICGSTSSFNPTSSAYLVKVDGNGDILNGLSPNIQPIGKNVFIYPNPVRDNAKIELKGVKHVSDKTKFILYNQVGQMLRTFSVPGETFILTRAGLASGFYIYTVQSEEGVIGSGSIVFQ